MPAFQTSPRALGQLWDRAPAFRLGEPLPATRLSVADASQAPALGGVYDHNCGPSQKPCELDDTPPPTQAVSQEAWDAGDLSRMEATLAVGDTVPPQC